MTTMWVGQVGMVYYGKSTRTLGMRQYNYSVLALPCNMIRVFRETERRTNIIGIYSWSSDLNNQLCQLYWQHVDLPKTTGTLLRPVTDALCK